VIIDLSFFLYYFSKHFFRERNKEHAKRSRVRKKMIQESLQRSINLLQEENDKLKAHIKEYLGTEALNEVRSIAESKSNFGSTVSSNGATSSMLQGQGEPRGEDNTFNPLSSNLVKTLQTAQQNFVISDPSLPDNPIVYASHGFLALTGYSLDQVLGRNCRFLQGPATSPAAIDLLRKGVMLGEDTTTVILNYRADGTTFWNQIFIGALRDTEGSIVNYLGVQCKVSEMYAQVTIVF
jgi:PAS domain S-box-containing protein